jgi:hypothetical protein
MSSRLKLKPQPNNKAGLHIFSFFFVYIQSFFLAGVCFFTFFGDTAPEKRIVIDGPEGFIAPVEDIRD